MRRWVPFDGSMPGASMHCRILGTPSPRRGGDGVALCVRDGPLSALASVARTIKSSIQRSGVGLFSTRRLRYVEIFRVPWPVSREGCAAVGRMAA